MAERLLPVRLRPQIVTAQHVPPALPDDGAEGMVEVKPTCRAQLLRREDSGGVEPHLHAAVDAGEVGEPKLVKLLRQILGFNSYEPVRLLQLGSDLRQEGVRG